MLRKTLSKLNVVQPLLCMSNSWGSVASSLKPLHNCARIVAACFIFVWLCVGDVKIGCRFCWLVGKVVLISAVVERYGLEPLFVLCGIFCASEMLGHFKDVELSVAHARVFLHVHACFLCAFSI